MRTNSLVISVFAVLLLPLVSTALATDLPPKILAVIPDIDPDGADQLFIVGKRLPGGQNLKVRLGGQSCRLVSPTRT